MRWKVYWLRVRSCLILNREDGPGKWKGGGVARGSDGVGELCSEGGVSEVEVKSCAITTQAVPAAGERQHAEWPGSVALASRRAAAGRVAGRTGLARWKTVGRSLDPPSAGWGKPG